MTMGRFFAIGQILWCLAACIGYAHNRQWWNATYWFLAASVSAVVTFGRIA